MRWKKTDWGIKVENFKLQYGLTIKAIADAADVKLPVLRQVMIGKTPGYDITEKVNLFMAEYEATHVPEEPSLTPFKEANVL